MQIKTCYSYGLKQYVKKKLLLVPLLEILSMTSQFLSTTTCIIGTPEAIIEHILEYLHSWKVTCYDETLEEFILMHLVFMSTKSLLDLLLKIYRSEDPLSSSFEKSMKRKVVYFVVRWSRIMTYEQPDSQAVEEFLRVRKL